MVYTRPGGGVSIATATPEFMRAACNGGDRRVACLPIDEWVERKVAQGHVADAAHRHARAWWQGGCSSAEAWAIVRDIEPRRIWNEQTRLEVIVLTPELVEDLPFDRWFRDAWRRSEDGGPIVIDLDAARDIQRQRMKAAISTWNRRAVEEDERESLKRLTNGPATIEWRWEYWREQLLRAQTPDAIRATWPEQLRWS